MSLTFDNQDGGLASWVRRSTNDTLGYWTSWMYWVQSVPYIVDVSNSVIVSFSWMIFGNNSLDKKMRSEEHTSELQSRFDLVCRLLLEKKQKAKSKNTASTLTRQYRIHNASA